MIISVIFEPPCRLFVHTAILCSLSTCSVRGHEDFSGLFSHSLMITVWTGVTNWSWQLSSYERLSFTPAPALADIPPAVQTNYIITWTKSAFSHAVIFTRTSVLFVLLLGLAFINNTQSVRNASSANPFDCRIPRSFYFAWQEICMIHVPTPWRYSSLTSHPRHCKCSAALSDSSDWSVSVLYLPTLWSLMSPFLKT